MQSKVLEMLSKLTNDPFKGHSNLMKENPVMSLVVFKENKV